MNIYLIFTIIAVAAYLIGSVNFARIIAWRSRNKDITTMGSGNPGTMNMLRNFGFVPALIVFLLEIAKAGLCCLITKIILSHTGYTDYAEFGYFFAGLFAVIGGIFPIFYGFKGGKGVACMVGVLMFTPLWWVGLIIFFVFATLLFFTDIAFISSLGFIVGMSIAITCWVFLYHIPYAWAIVVIVWALTVMTALRHSGNFARFFKGQEHKAGFKKSIKKLFKHQKGVEEISEEQVDAAPEVEIIIEDDKKDE